MLISGMKKIKWGNVIGSNWVTGSNRKSFGVTAELTPGKKEASM